MNPLIEIPDRKYGGWLWAVKLFGKSQRVFTDKTILCPKAWKHYYDEGLNPLQALMEDFKGSTR